MPELKINGQTRAYPDGQMPATLAELLAGMNIAEATIVAEIDGDIVERGTFASTALRHGQQIELIRFVGGG